MKQFLPFVILFYYSSSFAQNIHLSDSVIYFDETAAAYYSKTISNTLPRYDVSIYNNKKALLIDAVIKKFDAPVKELKPFYYYDIRFPDMKDSFSIYYSGQAFTIELAEMIRDYKLIRANQLDTFQVKAFKKTYSQEPMRNRISEMKSYLDDTRHYSRQAERDRTKPIRIINERTIMQDSVVIGYFTIVDVPFSNQYLPDAIPTADYMLNPTQKISVRLTSGDVVDDKYMKEYKTSMRRDDMGYKLFELSKPEKSMQDRYMKLLGIASCLVENYVL